MKKSSTLVCRVLTKFARFAHGEQRVGDPDQNGCMGTPVTAKEILRLRLQAQWIDPVAGMDAASVVRHLLAMQAQDFSQGLWAIGVRTKAAARADVLAAFERGEIVRTMPMRGTLHFVPPEELRWMLALTAERSLQSAATRFRTLGLDQSTLDRAADVAREALAGGRALSRGDFLKVLDTNGIDPAGQRGYHVIFYLTQLALVCWGPPSGTQQALVLVDEWIAPTPQLDHQEALERFALRYFTGHGPATERDLAWWTKLTITDIRAAIAGLGDRLTALELDGVTYFGASDTEVEGPPRSGIQLLPGFDEYLLAYQDRSLALEDENFQRIVPGNNGMFMPMIVSNGRVVGTWRRSAKTRRPEPEHFREASAARLARFATAAKRYDAFVDN